MNSRLIFVALLALCLFNGASTALAQISKPADKAAEKNVPPQDKSSQQYSGMYSFLKDGEFVQVTVEDGGHVTGFISRFGEGDSDKGEFLDQFFKSGKLEGSKLTFTTEVVHGIGYDFKGTVERGGGKNPGEEGYFVLKGTLTENSSDVNKKVTTQAREVTLKMFPQDASPAPVVRK